MPTFISRLNRFPVASTANARYKAWKVEHDAEATRRRYSLGHSQIVAPPLGGQFHVAVRERVFERAVRLGWPKAPGDLHIFLAYPPFNWEAVLPAALSLFGQVTTFEWHSRGFFESDPAWLDVRDRMNREMLKAFVTANRARPIDLVVGYMSGNTVSPKVLLEMAATGAIITNFCFDDKIYWPGKPRGGRYPTTAAIAQAIDLNLTSDPGAGARYYAHGGLSMFHAEAADPTWYRPVDRSLRYDVSFVGAAYGWRPRLVEGLRRRGIHVECFGKGWPNGPIKNESMNDLYARSRINLGCGGIGYSHKLLCLKGRDFEVPMSQAVYLTQHNPELSLVFEIGQEIVTYHSIEDCALIIRDLLADPDRAQQIRLAARRRSLRDHTYEARWTTVLKTIGALR